MLIVYDLQEEIKEKYKGCGKAWAAIKDEKVVDFIYMNSNSNTHDRKIDKRCKLGFRFVERPLQIQRQEFEEFRQKSREELAKKGEVRGGNLSCYEFVSSI